MTSVTLSRYDDTYIFECRGHTEYAPLGEDILCSAVSALCYTLRSYLEKAFSEGRICHFSSVFSKGDAHLSFDLCDEGDEGCIMGALDAVLCGFLLLEENFPDHIRTDF